MDVIDCFLFVRIETGVVVAMHVSLVTRKEKKVSANVEIFDQYLILMLNHSISS